VSLAVIVYCTDLITHRGSSCSRSTKGGSVGNIVGTDGAVLLVALGVACSLFVVALGVAWDQESRQAVVVEVGEKGSRRCHGFWLTRVLAVAGWGRGCSRTWQHWDCCLY